MKSNRLLRHPPEYHKDNEGWWGWLVVVSSFTTQAIIGGIAFSGGLWLLIFKDLLGSKNFETAGLGALVLTLITLGSIPGSILSYKVGYRSTVIIGGLISFLGFLLTMFCSQMHEFYITFGIPVGLGLGLALSPSLLILEYYFSESISLALSFAHSGTSFGTALFPLAIYHLEKRFAWRGLFMIMASVVLNLVLLGTIMSQKKPPTKAQKRNLISIFSFSLFKHPAFAIMLLCNFCWNFGSVLIFTFLPAFAMNNGLSYEKSVLLLAVVGISNFSSRGVFQVFSQTDRLDPMSNFVCSIGISALLTGVFPEFFRNPAGEIAYAILFGLHCGFWSSFQTHVETEQFKSESLFRSRGFSLVSIALAFLMSPPLGGYLLDEGYSYETLFYVAGGCMFASSTIMMLISLKKCQQPILAKQIQDESSTAFNSASYISSKSTGDWVEAGGVGSTEEKLVP